MTTTEITEKDLAHTCHKCNGDKVWMQMGVSCDLDLTHKLYRCEECQNIMRTNFRRGATVDKSYKKILIYMKGNQSPLDADFYTVKEGKVIPYPYQLKSSDRVWAKHECMGCVGYTIYQVRAGT